jgi:hypothetical protein
VLAAFDALRESTRLSKVGTGINARSLTFLRLTIDGALLERWFLKTLMNVGFGGELIIGPGKHAEGMPSLELVETAFGLRAFKSPSGLYLSSHAGAQVTSEDRVKIVTKSDSTHLVAARLPIFPQSSSSEVRDGRYLTPYVSRFEAEFSCVHSCGRQILSHQIAIKWLSLWSPWIFAFYSPTLSS